MRGKKIIKTILMVILGVSTLSAGGKIQEEGIDNALKKFSSWYKGFYGSIGFGAVRYEERYRDGVSSRVDIENIVLKAGYEILPYLAIEARYSVSVGGADEKWSDNSNRKDVDDTYRNFGVFIKPNYAFGNFKPYLLLGYGQVSFGYEGTPTQKETGFQWGGGLEYAITPHVSFFAEYLSIYDQKGFDEYLPDVDYKIREWALGLTYRF